jgi:hypothetical protein
VVDRHGQLARSALTDEFGARSAFHVFAEVPWLQPYPDRLLDELAPSDTQPDAVVVARETIGLTYLAVIQLLPPRQRAVLILRDVLDWSAREAADLLDMTVAAALVREDIRVTMPPHPWCFDGLAEIRPLLEEGLTAPGEWRLLPTRANRQPTAASYLRAAGDTEFRAFKFDVLRIEGGRIAEITTFDATLFPAFGLPPTL